MAFNAPVQRRKPTRGKIVRQRVRIGLGLTEGVVFLFVDEKLLQFRNALIHNTLHSNP